MPSFTMMADFCFASLSTLQVPILASLITQAAPATSVIPAITAPFVAQGIWYTATAMTDTTVIRKEARIKII